MGYTIGNSFWHREIAFGIEVQEFNVEYLNELLFIFLKFYNIPGQSLVVKILPI